MAHDPAPGEPWILNDPYAGGTHLPDLTIVTRTELGYAVTRAHHADVGGVDPGSLPPESRTLDEEGVVIPPTRLDEETLDSLVARMRNPDERRGDLRAQLAAHRLAESASPSSAPDAAASAVADAMEALLRLLRAGRPRRDPRSPGRPLRGSRRARDARGRSSRSAQRSPSTGDSIDVDFAGHGAAARRQPELPARRHSLCLLLRRPLPHGARSAGLGRRLRARHRARTGGLPRQRPLPGSGGGGQHGDVEPDHGRRLRRVRPGVPVPAQGQGTMNNVVFGYERFTYYETIGGGQGACPDADGPSGVHVAMSNTLNTPAEALELAYPLRVERYELRRGSGGAGSAARRRRRRPRAPRPRGLPALAPHAAEAPRAARRSGRRRRAARAGTS